MASAAYTLDGITHYPPVNNSFNSIDAVFAASSGTNGGYYNLSTVADIDYGAYNYCNMPHVRAREYEVPTGYSLQYLEIIHRHHKRTPYASNLFPYEDIPLYCDDTKMYFYAATKNGVDTSAIWWKDYMDADNPMMFVKNGFNSTCQFPQISFAGLEDSSQHGRDLWSVYGDKIHYLPKEFDPATMIVRVTNNQITSQVAGALIKGLYPDANDFTVYQQVASQDSLEPGYTCGPADDLRSAYEDTDAWFKHLNMSQDLFTALDTISGVDPTDSGWHSYVFLCYLLISDAVLMLIFAIDGLTTTLITCPPAHATNSHCPATSQMQPTASLKSKPSKFFVSATTSTITSSVKHKTRLFTRQPTTAPSFPN